MRDTRNKRYSDELTDDELRAMEFEEDMGTDAGDVTRMPAHKRKLADFLYDPKTELTVLLLVVISVVLLVVEIALPDSGSVGWMGGLTAGELGGGFFYADVVLSILFATEYGLKLWVAPRKWYFVRHNWIDLLAILPVLRILRIGRALRLLRLLRLLRVMRIAPVLTQHVQNMSAEVHKRTAENTVIVIYLIFSIVFGTVGILVFEKGADSGFETIGDGLWWCIVTLTTVGYGDKFPVTFGGKTVAAVLMFIGLSFYALLTGVLSSMLIDRSRREEGRGMDVISLVDHVVVCGWNSNGERLIEDLLAADRDMHAIVLSADEEIPRVLNPQVHYITEDSATEKGLETARVRYARVVVVLSDTWGGRPGSDADARSVLTALAVERMNPDVHTIVEILNEDNLFHLRNADVDEIVVSGSYTGTMLSQAVQFPGISDVFGDLFRTAAGSQLREFDLPPDAAGKRFGEVVSQMLEDGAGVMVGFRRNGHLEMTPPAHVTMEPGDMGILVARAIAR